MIDRCRLFGLATVVILITLGTARAAAQTGAAEPAPGRWSVALLFGGNSGGPARPLADVLRAQDWDDTRSGGMFFDPSFFPDYSSGDMAWGLRVGYRFGRHLGVTGMWAADELGSARGNRVSGPLSASTTIGFYPTVRTHAALATWTLALRPSPLLLRAEAGPALFVARMNPETDLGKTVVYDGDDSEWSAGAVLGLGADARIWKVRVSVDGQRRFVGDVEHGPYTIDDPAGDGVHEVRQGELDFDHNVVLVGIGLAF